MNSQTRSYVPWKLGKRVYLAIRSLPRGTSLHWQPVISKPTQPKRAQLKRGWHRVKSARPFSLSALAVSSATAGVNRLFSLPIWKYGEMAGQSLALLDSKYLCPALGACAACSRPLVLEGNFLGVLDLNLCPALYAISLCHSSSSLL